MNSAAIPAPRRGSAKKSMREVYPAAFACAENLQLLMRRYRDTQGTLAAYIGITDRTLRARFQRPWEFRMSELADAARRYDVTVAQLARPMKFEDAE